ncbi:MAG: hypothetical protein LBT31_04060 [Synergistaceae bacterium]|jgi:hypothetical protein|nr:hypothetical protein [Synergistaceae bacterium]
MKDNPRDPRKYTFIIQDKIIMLITILMLCCYTAIEIYNRPSPLTKEQVYNAVAEKAGSENIVRISLSQGDMAGDIGFFFIEISPDGYMVVPNDARLPMDYWKTRFDDIGKWMGKDRKNPGHITFLDFFLDINISGGPHGFFTTRGKYPNICNTWILLKEDWRTNQIFWEHYNPNTAILN